MVKESISRFEKHPYTCIADATRYLDTVVVRDAGVRNVFFMKIRPFVIQCVEGTLRRCQVWLEPTDRDDLGSCVDLYLLEKWFPRLRVGRAKTSSDSVAAYLTATVRGLVKNFLAEMFTRIEREPGEWDYEPEVTFVKAIDFKLDREELRQGVERNVEDYLKIRRRRATEVREVVERMMRVLAWKAYEREGECVVVGGCTK